MRYLFSEFPLLANFLGSLFCEPSYSPFLSLDLLLIGSFDFLKMLGDHERDPFRSRYVGSSFLTHEGRKVDDMSQHDVVPRLNDRRLYLSTRRIGTGFPCEPAFGFRCHYSISYRSLMQSFCLSLVDRCILVVFELDERVEILI